MQTKLGILQFITQLNSTTEVGFHLTRPYHLYETIVGVHNAHKLAIAWESRLSFAAYKLTTWLTALANTNAPLLPEAQWLLGIWQRGVQQDGWSFSALTCWQRRPRPELHPKQDKLEQAQQMANWNLEQQQAIHDFNQFIQQCRLNLATCPNPALAEASQAQQQQLADRNYQSAWDYLTTLKHQYSRLLVVRLDVFYTQSTRQTKTLADLKKDKEAFFKNRTRLAAFNHLLGYVWTFELGDKKGLHCHLLLLFDAKYRNKDAWIANQLGEHWMNVTQGEGVYYNANDKDSKERLRHWQTNSPNYQSDLKRYAPQQADKLFQSTVNQQAKGKNTLGIGLVHRSNEVAWANLSSVLSYFTKLEQTLPYALKNNIRYFGKGTVKDLPKNLPKSLPKAPQQTS